jgi:hypothetical protein
MSEYVATITVKRSARGEGDESVLIAGASSSVHTSFVSNPGVDKDEDAMLLAIERALQIVKAAIDARPV